MPCLEFTLTVGSRGFQTNLDDSIQRWSGFLEQIHNLNKTVEYLQTVTDEVSEFQATMSEKRAQLERIKCLEEKVRCEKIEVDSLKAKAVEMLASGQQSHAASQAQEILNKFDFLAERIKVRLAWRVNRSRFKVWKYLRNISERFGNIGNFCDCSEIFRNFGNISGPSISMNR